MRIVAALPLAAAIALQPSCTTRRAAATPFNTQIEAALNWMPADTEVIAAVNQPGVLENPNGATLASLVPGLAFAGMPETFHVRYSFAVDGSRNFRGPKSIGVGSHEGCKVIGLEPAEYQRAELYAKQKSLRHGTVEGLVAYVFEYKDP